MTGVRCNAVTIGCECWVTCIFLSCVVIIIFTEPPRTRYSHYLSWCFSFFAQFPLFASAFVHAFVCLRVRIAWSVNFVVFYRSKIIVAVPEEKNDNKRYCVQNSILRHCTARKKQSHQNFMCIKCVAACLPFFAFFCSLIFKSSFLSNNFGI